MRLLIVRHGVAAEREDFAATGKDDDLRPLTTDGRRKMRRIAKGLLAITEPPDLLVASPLTRAMQTAKILAELYGVQAGATVDALRPDSPLPMFAEWAGQQTVHSTIAIVGHEPHLSELTTWLMSGRTESRIVLKKGGACLLSFEGSVRRGEGMLEWLATPSQLRLLGAS